MEAGRVFHAKRGVHLCMKLTSTDKMNVIGVIMLKVRKGGDKHGEEE